MHLFNLSYIINHIEEKYIKISNITFDMELRSIQLDLTSRCNLGCDFCPYHGIEGIIKEVTELPLEVYAKMVSDLATFPFKPTVKLAGSGEPTLYRDFDRLVLLMAEHGIPVRLITNGTTLDKKAEFLATTLSQLVVSIHGDEITHDKTVMMEGAYQRAYTGIEKVRSLNESLPIIHHSVITPQNYTYLESMADRAASYQTTPRFQHLKFTPGNDQLGDFDLTVLLFQMDKVRSRHVDAIFEPDMNPAEIKSYYDASKVFILNKYGCWRVEIDVPVRRDGNVMACDGSSMGNITEQSILGIVAGQKRANFVRMVQLATRSPEGLPDFCSRCCYNSKEPVTLYSSAPDKIIIGTTP